MKLRTKRSYLLLVIAITILVSASIYTTYAFLTYSKVENNYNVNALELPFVISSNEKATLSPGTSSVFNLGIKNDKVNGSIYYEVYHTIGDTTNVIVAELVNDKNVNTTPINANGNLSKDEMKTVQIIVINNSTSDITFDIGIAIGYVGQTITYGTGMYPSNGKKITSTYNILDASVVSSKKCIVQEEKIYCSLVPGVVETDEPNAPDLHDGMIPIKYNDTIGQWLKASDINLNYDWYRYSEGEWANVAIVTSTSRDTYMNAPVNTPINESDILGYFVWIPRFKYKLWNVTAVSSTFQEIEIAWEQGNSSTGNVTCSTSSTNGVETCTNKTVGGWYTHPGFNRKNGNGMEQLGIWIGKYMTTGTSTVPTVKPNLIALTGQTMYNQVVTSNLFKSSTYFTNDGMNTVYASMARNTEYAAMMYLTQSKYGRCNGSGTCMKITWNNSTGYYTGKAGINASTGVETTSTVANGTTDYNTEFGVLASTTGNVTGVYDTSGGAFQRVLAFMSSSGGNSFHSYSSSGYTTTTMPFSECGGTKIDCYQYNSSNSTWTTSKLGDGIGETRGFGGNQYVIYTSSPFFARSYYANGGYNTVGLFSTYQNNGVNANNITFRMVLERN